MVKLLGFISKFLIFLGVYLIILDLGFGIINLATLVGVYFCLFFGCVVKLGCIISK